MRRGFFAFGLVVLVAVTCVVVPQTSGESRPPHGADTLPPTGTILYPLPGTWQGNPYVQIGVRFTDPDGIMVSSFSITVDGISLVMGWNGIVLTAYAQGLPEGPHAAEARASDQLGNGPTILSWSFFTDTTPPVVNITSPSGNPELVGGSVTLTWTGSDLDSGIDHYEVQIDGGPWIDVGTATAFPFPDLAPGIRYFHVRAYDVAGNSDYASAVATVPAPPPPDPGNTTLVVTLSGEIPSWAIALIVISVVELAAIVVLALRQRRGSPGSGRPDA